MSAPADKRLAEGMRAETVRFLRVGAMAMVRADVPERTVVIGSPARVLRPIREDEAFDRWRDGGERPTEG